MTSATTVVKDPAKVRFVYREGLFSSADILSVGVASFGRLNSVHYQNQHEFDPYLAAVSRGELPVFRAYVPPEDERLIREFILHFKLGRNSVSHFQKKFGVNVLERFATPLQRLKDWGFLTIEGDELKLNREALLEVDRLLHEFFLPQHLTNRTT